MQRVVQRAAVFGECRRVKHDKVVCAALAFFVGLDRAAVPVAEFGPDETLSYLRRAEVRPDALAEGMNLVCAEGRALGFAKRIGGRVNNLYPNSLRILKQ